MATDTNTKSMSLIVTKGSLDWAYPPFILATTAAAMGLNVTMFFTFYGLSLLKKKLDLKVTTLGNPAMEMPMLEPSWTGLITTGSPRAASISRGEGASPRSKVRARGTLRLAC